jgi:hypothetical protein
LEEKRRRGREKMEWEGKGTAGEAGNNYCPQHRSAAL